MTTNKQIKVWSIKTSLIHIMLTYTINEHNRDANLLKNKNILLSLSICTKLQDQIAFDISHKHNQSQKLVIDNDNVNALKNCTNYKKNSILSKETEKNMSALFWKWKHFKKHFLSTDSSERKLINMWQVDSLNVDDLLYKYITKELKLSAVSQINADIMIFDILD